MSIKVAVRHCINYEYDCHISLGPQVIRLRAAPHSRTHRKGYSLNIRSKNHFINWQQDPFGNYLEQLVFPDKVKFVEIDLEVINPFDFFTQLAEFCIDKLCSPDSSSWRLGILEFRDFDMPPHYRIYIVI